VHVAANCKVLKDAYPDFAMAWKWKFSTIVSLLKTLSKHSSIKGEISLIPTADVTKKKEIEKASAP